MSKKIVDYTEELKKSGYYGNAILLTAQGNNQNYLALFKVLKDIDSAGRRRFFYQLEYRWLSEECKNSNDEAYVCVVGREVQYYSSKELNKINPKILIGKANLFNCFQLC